MNSVERKKNKEKLVTNLFLKMWVQFQNSKIKKIDTLLFLADLQSSRLKKECIINVYCPIDFKDDQ